MYLNYIKSNILNNTKLYNISEKYTNIKMHHISIDVLKHLSFTNIKEIIYNLL